MGPAQANVSYYGTAVSRTLASPLPGSPTPTFSLYPACPRPCTPCFASPSDTPQSLLRLAFATGISHGTGVSLSLRCSTQAAPGHLCLIPLLNIQETPDLATSVQLYSRDSPRPHERQGSAADGADPSLPPRSALNWPRGLRQAACSCKSLHTFPDLCFRNIYLPHPPPKARTVCTSASSSVKCKVPGRK